MGTEIKRIVKGVRDLSGRLYLLETMTMRDETDTLMVLRVDLKRAFQNLAAPAGMCVLGSDIESHAPLQWYHQGGLSGVRLGGYFGSLWLFRSGRLRIGCKVFNSLEAKLIRSWAEGLKEFRA